MEPWRRVWRDGFAPVLSESALAALAKGLTDDDPRLAQGLTTTPPPLMSVQDWPVEAACPIGYCGWKGHDLETVGQVEEFFAKACFEMNTRLGETDASRVLIHWLDNEPRERMRATLLHEVNLELSKRAAEEVDSAHLRVCGVRKPGGLSEGGQT